MIQLLLLAEATDAVPEAALACADLKGDCYFWATVGHCEDNAGFMARTCSLSCGSCSPPDSAPYPLLDSAAAAPYSLAAAAERAAAAPAPLLLLFDGAGSGSTQPLGLPAGERIVSLSAGELHLLVRTASGAVYAFADNAMGQLGRPLSASRLPYTAWQPYALRWPGRSGGLAAAAAVDACAGRMHSAAVLASGEVFAWGDNGHGQCGVLPEETPMSVAPAELEMLDAPLALPARVPLPEHATAVACGELHTLVLGASGAVYAFGDNGFGQLGARTEHAVETPLKVPLPLEKGEAVVGLAAAASHSLARTSGGRLLGWGDNTHGQLGEGRRGFTASAAAVPLPLRAGEEVVEVAASSYHSAARTSGGRLLLWGDNSFGQLGAEASNASQVGEAHSSEPFGGVEFGAAALALGEYHTLALCNASHVWSFGYNGRYQLARTRGVRWDGMPQRAELPLPKADPPSLLAAGAYFSAAVSRSGHLVVWGEHPSAAERAGAAPASGLYTWGENAARQLCRSLDGGLDYDAEPGLASSVAGLLPDGELPVFGCGGFHTLVHAGGGPAVLSCGGGEEDDEADSAEDSVVHLAGGHVHSVALSAKGRVWTWGSNSHGQLGWAPVPPPSEAAVRLFPPGAVRLPPRHRPESAPAATAAPPRVVAVAAGGYHTLALTEEGDVYSWGANHHGQLLRASPSPVDPMPRWAAVPGMTPAPSPGVVWYEQRVVW
ncbi:hypothetical protein EMIHUDRAFT_202418 [Emiliania huxleyi CCMP1516]|uniref:ShKT domain-containing protein n=2 Tax=Emiliania huxleyi TaxID=2903 RepID=A0A0D3KBQ6_EMIH1|nr:hypothetical protein EMIHUDRAFT_202418 [Emiliania huxleyi CCMP1516]EOD33191.1 hypothetical protein EMIHUDRAFT_202418 [Emiliania huxleyi CCMP1516]|eukprot:XP_005785620.1 hypothetical protein EMIHUDRAFT_202418 [Emiliania huxleyi CCMP1516]